MARSCLLAALALGDLALGKRHDHRLLSSGQFSSFLRKLSSPTKLLGLNLFSAVVCEG